MRRLLFLSLAAISLAACGNDVRLYRHSEPRMRRLLARQYTNAVEALLGADSAALAKPPLDIASQGFDSIGASTLSPSDTALAQYEKSARGIQEHLLQDVGKMNTLMGCTPSGMQDVACFEKFVRSFGKKAFRRTLTPDEVTRYTNLAMVTAQRNKNAYAGASYVVTAFLQSPLFLYQVEVGEKDPDEGSRRRLTGVEIATRMAFFLTDRPPDEAMIDVAESGKLQTRDEIRAAAMAMLEGEGAKRALDGFYEERMKLRQLEQVTKDTTAFPMWKPELRDAMKQESLMLLRDVVWTQNGDYRDLFTADYAFVNSDLANLYGVSPVSGTGFEKRMLPATRRGIFGQASFLAIEAHPSTTSPTRRGKFISERMLCMDIPPPPGDVNTVLPEPMMGPQTMRQRLAKHNENPTCASCHVRMDGIGLALEHFDALGAYRDKDQGLAIDASGEVHGIAKFDGLDGLASLVRERPELDRCWVRSLYRHATGHYEAEADEQALEDVDGKFEESNYRLKQLLVEIVVSDAFRFVDNPGGV